MLDDLKMIHERDAQDALGMAERQWQQLAQAYPLPAAFRPAGVRNVVFAGMGGVAASAALCRAWLNIGVPFEIVRDYDLPAYADSSTLCIVASYSGNTEETLSALQQALQKGAQLAVIAHGGQLKALAQERGLPLLELPDTGQPRFATWYTGKALATVLDAAGLTDGAAGRLAAQSDWLRDAIAGWRPDVATARNDAKKLALELVGRSVVVYAGPRLAPLAYKWKISFNENSKQVAWSGVYPEFNHNEFMGWTKQPVQKPYAVVDIRSDLEHPRVQKRFEVSEKLLSGQRPAPHVVQPLGGDVLQQLLYGSALSDFVSIYLALLNGINPTPAVIVDKLKEELA